MLHSGSRCHYVRLPSAYEFPQSCGVNSALVHVMTAARTRPISAQRRRSARIACSARASSVRAAERRQCSPPGSAQPSRRTCRIIPAQRVAATLPSQLHEGEQVLFQAQMSTISSRKSIFARETPNCCCTGKEAKTESAAGTVMRHYLSHAVIRTRTTRTGLPQRRRDQYPGRRLVCASARITISSRLI